MRNQQNGRNPQAGQLSSPYQIRELKERLDSVEVDQESLKSQVDNVEKKAEESASGSGESGTNATFLYLRAQDGPAIKNNSGSVTFDIMKVEGNDSADVYQGSDFDIRNYDPTKSGASGQNFGQQVTLNASDIDGKQTLYLCVSDGSEVVDTDTAVDITDGQGGGYVEAVTPVTATYLQQDASFTISPLKVRGYFYKTGTTTNPEIARVQLYPTYDGSLKATYTKTKDLDSDGTSPISVSVQNQNGNALNEGQSATAKLAREVVVKFTYEDPNTSQTAVATETLYLTTETGPGDYVSYVFQRSDSQPSRPANSAGGTYNDPSVPTDWSDAPPVGEKRLWLSKATYEYASDGPVDTDEDGNVWSTPVRLKGEDSGLFTLFASKPKPTDPDKTNISGRPGSTTWSGSSDWKTTPNDLSTDAYYMARAVWKNESWQSFDVTRIKGEKGDAAQIVRIDASSQVFTLQKDGTHAPSSITLRAVQQNIDNPTFEWTYNGSTTQSTNVSILPEDLGEDGTVSVTLSEVGTSNSDEITLVRVTEGADASTVVLSNQNHTYPADQDGNVDSSLFSKGASEIEAYVGASRANVLQSRLGAASASQKGGTTTSGFAHVLYDGSASNLGLSSGDDVTFVGEIRTAQNTSQSGRLLVEFWDGSGGKISDIKSDLENSTEWQSLSTNGAVPVGTNRIVLGYAVESVSSGNEQLVEGRYGSIHKSTQPLPAYNAYISETNINGSVDRSQPQTISYEPSGSMTNDRASALVTFKIVREDGEVEARDKQIEYSKARAGTDSEVLSLSASSQVFAVNKSGNVSTQNPISLLVNRQNISSSVTWKTKNADGTDSPVTLTSKSDSLAELSYSDLENAGKQQVTVRAEADGYSDEVTIAIVREGKDAVTALLSNENHSYSASSDGSISDPSTGATTLSVYEGANKLSGGGGTPGFSVSVTKNNVSGSYSGGTFTPSGMSASEGSVNFEITVTKSDGSTQTINKTATYSVVTDGASASSVSIEAESQVFRVSKSGSVSPSQIGLNSVKQNVSSVSWSASDNVSFDGTPKSGYDQSVSKSSLDANEVGQVSITASGGGDSDTLTLAIIREGSDALTPILTNENHTFTAASDGTIAGSEYSSGATDVKIYEGATQLSADSTSNPSNGTFNVSSVTTTNINASKTENASSFTISPSGGMDNSESASIDITIDVVKQNGDEATITKTVTYSKSVAGADGSDAKAVSLSAQSQIFAVNQSDSVTTVNPIEFTANKENISSGFSWSTFNTNGNDSSVTLSSTNGNTATLSYSDLTGASEKEVTVRASAGGLFDEITVSIVEDGTDAVTVLLSNENHTYQAQSDKTVPDYSTGKTTIKVYRGDSQLSVGSDFSVSKSESNVRGNLVDAVYTPTGMSSGEGSVEFTVTVNKAGGGTETFTKTATYSKSIAGEDNQDFDFLGVDKSKIKDTAGLYTNNDFLGYFRDDANGSLNPNERARAYLDNSGNFYLNDENENTGPGLVYESNLSGGNGIFAVGDIGEAKDYHQGNSVSSSSSFLSYSKASSNSELVFKGEIDAFGRIESFNPGGELAVRIDNDETFNTPASSNNQSDSSFTLSSSGDSTTTSVSIESGTNEVTITISGNAGYFEIGGGDSQFEGGTYNIPSSMQVELKASSSGALLTEEWLQINESSVSGKTVSVSFDGQGHAGENIAIVVSNVYANNGNISLNGITVKSYTPTTEINARGVQVAYTSTDYVRIGASGITSTGGIETGSGAGVNFTSEGKLYADGSALYWSSGSNLTRIDSKVVEGTSGDSDKLDGNHGSYYLDASNINAGTLGTSYVPDLSASKITSGTLGTSRIPNLDASKINSGTLGTARIPNLDASKITSGTFDAARIPDSTQYSDSDAVSAIESTRITSLRLENQEFDSTSADESRGVFVFDKSAGLAYFNDANNAPGGDLSGTDATKWHRVLDTDVLNTGSELTLSRNGTEDQVGLSIDQGDGSGLNADSVDGYEGNDFGVLSENETVTGSWSFLDDVLMSGGAGSIQLHLEADTGSGAETNQPSIKLSQDGGFVNAYLGFFDGSNDLVLRSSSGNKLKFGTNGRKDDLVINDAGTVTAKNSDLGVTGSNNLKAGSGHATIHDRNEYITGEWRIQDLAFKGQTIESRTGGIALAAANNAWLRIDTDNASGGRHFHVTQDYDGNGNEKIIASFEEGQKLGVGGITNADATFTVQGKSRLYGGDKFEPSASRKAARDKAGLYVKGSNSNAGEGNYGGAVMLGSAKGGPQAAGIAGVQQSSDGDSNALAFLAHGGTFDTPTQQLGVLGLGGGHLDIDLRIGGTSYPQYALDVTGQGRFSKEILSEQGVVAENYNVSTLGGSGYALRKLDGGSTQLYSDEIVANTFRVAEFLVNQTTFTASEAISAGFVAREPITDNGSGEYVCHADTNPNVAVGDLVRAKRFTDGSHDSRARVQSVNRSGSDSTVKIQLVNDGNGYTTSSSSNDAPKSGFQYARIGNTGTNGGSTSRQNLIYLTASDASNPRIDFFEDVSQFSDFGSSALTTRLGNLDGLSGVNSNDMGLYTEVLRATGDAIIGDLNKNGPHIQADGGNLYISSGVQIGGEPADHLSLGLTTFNEDFEAKGVDRWSEASNTRIVLKSYSYSGDYSAQFKSSVGTSSASSTGQTGGVEIAIPERLALQFGGRRVEVSMYVKEDPNQYSGDDIAVAYSTSDVGNSGWNTFSVSTSWTRISFTYNVPAPNQGGKDHLGILGSANGNGSHVLVDQIVIRATHKDAETTSGAASKVASLEDDVYDDPASKGTTIISGGEIVTNLINVGELNAIAATIGGFDISNGAISTSVGGVEMALGSTGTGTSWSNSGIRGFTAGTDGNNRMWMGVDGNNDAMDFAVRSGGNYIVRLGEVNNKIAGWDIDANKIYNGNVEIGTSVASENGVHIGDFASGDFFDQGFFAQKNESRQARIGIEGGDPGLTVREAGGDRVSIGAGSEGRSSMGITVRANGATVLETDEFGTSYVDNLEVRGNADILGALEANAIAPQGEKLKLHYSFDSFDPSDDYSLKDLSGSGNHSDGIVGVAQVPGVVGTAGAFKASNNDYLDTSGDLEFAYQSFTLSAWVKTSATDTNTIISTRKYNFGGGQGYSFQVHNSNISFSMEDDNGDELSFSGSIDVADFNWHHVVAVIDHRNEIRLYVDGELDAIRGYDFGDDIANGATARVGVRNNGDGNFFGGRIDELRAYGRELSQGEVRSLYLYPKQNQVKIDGGEIVAETITAEKINTDNLFTQNLDFTGNLSQNIGKKTVFQVSAEERKIMIADDGGNKTASLTKQGNLSINKIKNYQATSYDASSGNADSTPSTVKYYLDVNTPQGPGRIPVYETPDTQAPDTPSNLSVSDGADFAFADIQFTASGDNGGSGIAYFNIYRAGTANGNYQIVKEVSGAANPGDTVLTTDGSVNAGNRYWYKVSAVDNAGNESSLSGYNSAYITKDFDYQPPGDDDRLDRERA